MQAIQVSAWGGPEVLTQVEVPDPAPGVGQVLVRVRAIGVNPVETYVRSGAYGKDRPLPFTPGSDAAGDVIAVGDGVEGVKPGARVYTSATVSGAYAEKTVCKAEDVHALPDGVTYEQGAALGIPYATAYRALIQRGGAVPGETVLIHGASGGVGIATVQFARAAGVTIIGTAGSEEGRRLVHEQGAQHVLDHKAERYLQRVMEITGGRGVDLVVEMLANVNLGHALEVLAPAGRVAVVGSRGRVEIDPRELMRREADVRGVMLMLGNDKERRATYAAIGAGLESGALRPIIGEVVPLAEAARAHDAIINSVHHGKIVLVPEGVR